MGIKTYRESRGRPDLSAQDVVAIWMDEYRFGREWYAQTGNSYWLHESQDSLAQAIGFASLVDYS